MCIIIYLLLEIWDKAWGRRKKTFYAVEGKYISVLVFQSKSIPAIEQR